MIEIKYPTGSKVVVRFTGFIRSVETHVEKEMIILGHRWHQESGVDKLIYFVDETTEGKAITSVTEKDIVGDLATILARIAEE